MPQTITESDFRNDRHGKIFADALDDDSAPLRAVLAFFSDADRQRRMEESEVHHNRAPLAGVVRELESLPEVHRHLSQADTRSAQRLRKAIGIVVRMVMERRGWRKTGKVSSLGVRAEDSATELIHNSRGLALWFARAERYTLVEGMPFESLRTRVRALENAIDACA